MPTKTPEPLTIQIRKLKRTRKSIVIFWKQGDGKFDLDEKDNPLPEFISALDALPPLVCTILGTHDTFAENMRVIGLVMGEQGKSPTVSLIVRKGLSDASKEFAFTTPPRLLAHPTEPGSYTPPLTEADASLVWEAVEQAKAYVRGERAQGKIEFDGEDDDATAEEEATEAIPFPEGATP